MAVADQVEQLRELGFTALEELGQVGGRTLFQLAVSGEQALGALETLRGAFQSTGLWPMVLGLDGPFAHYLGDAFNLTEAEVAHALKEAEAIDVDAWFAARREELGVGDPDDLGTWPKGVKPWLSVIEALYREQGVLKPSVNVLLVPVQAAWHVPILLGFGGWNDCPSPAELAALSSHWHATHGADPVSIGSSQGADTLGWSVEKPPLDRRSALLLVKELYICATF